MKQKNFTQITGMDVKSNLANLTHLVFEVTDACNLRCKYCGYADLYLGYDKRENLKFPFMRAKQVINYLHALWSKHYVQDVTKVFTVSFYGGEPLLNVSFIRQVIEHIESLPFVGKKFHYNMTTNAILLDKYMDFLVENNFHLLISLDGDEESQGYRVDTAGNNSFRKVFANVMGLRDKYPEYFKRYVNFNAVLHNKNSVERIFRFIKDSFGKTPAIAPLNTSGIRPDKIEEFKRTYRNFNESIKEANNCDELKAEMFIKAPETNRVMKYLYYQSGNVFFNYNGLLLNNNKIQIIPTGTCTPFAKKMFITVNGKILQCEKINHEFAVGLVTDEGLELDFDAIAKQHNDYVFRYVNQCEKCGNRNSCMECIYQIDDIHDKTTHCYGFCTEKQKQEQNEQSLRYLSEHPELYKRLLYEVAIKR